MSQNYKIRISIGTIIDERILEGVSEFEEVGEFMVFSFEKKDIPYSVNTRYIIDITPTLCSPLPGNPRRVHRVVTR